MFYVLRGIVKKIMILGKQKQSIGEGDEKQNKIIEIKRFSQGEYCPGNMKGVFRFELITETACELIVIKKRLLRQLKNGMIDGS